MTSSAGSKVESGIRQELAALPVPLGGWDPVGVRPRFGSYRGFVRLLLAEMENGSGAYRRYTQIRWESVKRVVFVCHGNICRSPYAERRAETYGLTTASFGLSAGTGAPADPSARRIAARRGVELADHRACDATDFEFQSGDLLLIMEPRQARAMLRRLPTIPCQVTLLGLWSRPRRPHIHDPHRRSEPYWEQCFDVIDSAVRTIAERMRLSPPHGG
jgi:protein-tyrosine phosphatase